jgi:hypothetical protein
VGGAFFVTAPKSQWRSAAICEGERSSSTPLLLQCLPYCQVQRLNFAHNQNIHFTSDNCDKRHSKVDCLLGGLLNPKRDGYHVGHLAVLVAWVWSLYPQPFGVATKPKKKRRSTEVNRHLPVSSKSLIGCSRLAFMTANNDPLGVEICLSVSRGRIRKKAFWFPPVRQTGFLHPAAVVTVNAILRACPGVFAAFSTATAQKIVWSCKQATEAQNGR